MSTLCSGLSLSELGHNPNTRIQISSKIYEHKTVVMSFMNISTIFIIKYCKQKFKSVFVRSDPGWMFVRSGHTQPGSEMLVACWILSWSCCIVNRWGGAGTSCPSYTQDWFNLTECTVYTVLMQKGGGGGLQNPGPPTHKNMQKLHCFNPSCLEAVWTGCISSCLAAVWAGPISSSLEGRAGRISSSLEARAGCISSSLEARSGRISSSLEARSGCISSSLEGRAGRKSPDEDDSGTLSLRHTSIQTLSIWIQLG